MKSLKNKKWSLLLVPIISAFLFVTIVTAAPLTVIGDLHTNIQTIETVAPKIEEKPTETLATTTTTLKPANIPASIPATTPSSSSLTSSTPKQPAPATHKTTLATSTNQKTAPKTQPTSTQPTTRSITASSNSSTQANKASAIIATSKQYIGVPYLYGGTTPSGFDCSGFVQYVFAKNGIKLPRVSRDQFKVGTSVSFSNLKPGDIVFFSLAKNGVVDHEGIYVGNNQFINASTSKGVTIYSLGSYWQAAYIGAKRIL